MVQGLTEIRQDIGAGKVERWKNILDVERRP
jgi:hypothetical protein